jgi:glycine cleavage system H protein
MNAPSGLQFTAEHEWIDVEGHTATIGITSYAADQLGDVVYVELPEVGASITEGTVVGEVESTKSVGELFAPMTGEVIETNERVVARPELVNSDPFGGGWLIKVRFETLPKLMDEDEYESMVADK